MNKKIIALILSSVMLIPTTNAFAANVHSESLSAKNSNVIITPKTMYQWHTSSYMYPSNWTRVYGPSGNNYNFKLSNPEGTHYHTLYISWSASYMPDMNITLTNVSSGSSQTETAYAGDNHLYFTDLSAGTYKITAEANGNPPEDVDFYVETQDPGW